MIDRYQVRMHQCSLILFERNSQHYIAMSQIQHTDLVKAVPNPEA
jgi:hypothetical protein